MSFLKKVFYIGLQQISRDRSVRIPEPSSSIEDQAVIEGNLRDGLEGSLALVYGLICAILESYDLGSLKKALDVGTGTGVLLSKIARLFPETQFVGIDISPTMLEVARGVTRGCDNIELILCNLYDLRERFAGEKFDLITWALGLHHMPDEEMAKRAISVLLDLLSPNGYLFVFDIERPKTKAIAEFIADTFNSNWGPEYRQDALNSYLAGFSYEELERILKGLGLSSYIHRDPFWANIFQYVLVPPAPKRPRRLRKKWQTHYEGPLWFDFLLLRLGFGL